MRHARRMRVRLLGTGASDGWPNPWCDCASCTAAAAADIVRGQTSALVDDRLLLDIGPEAPRAALRQGTSLAGVDAVLVTHAHPDHHAPPAWMWRGWAARRRPLTLVAPAAVVGDARQRLDDTVTAVEVVAGDELEVAGYTVRVLPAEHTCPGEAVLYDVTGPDGVRLLWGTDSGPLSERALTMTSNRGYDLVLLELTSGHQENGHLDLTTWPQQLAELRTRGAVTDTTRVLAVHLGHDNPPPEQLDRLLSGWGAEAPRDGTLLELPPTRSCRRRRRPGCPHPPPHSDGSGMHSGGWHVRRAAGRRTRRRRRERCSSTAATASPAASRRPMSSSTPVSTSSSWTGRRRRHRPCSCCACSSASSRSLPSAPPPFPAGRRPSWPCATNSRRHVRWSATPSGWWPTRSSVTPPGCSRSSPYDEHPSSSARHRCLQPPRWPPNDSHRVRGAGGWRQAPARSGW